MITIQNDKLKSIYTFSYTEEELELCKLEMRAFFGMDSISGTLESHIQVDPTRSPFMNERIDVLLESESISEMAKKVKNLPKSEMTFKVVFVKNPSGEKLSFKERQAVEKEVGLQVRGDIDLNRPEQLFGIMKVNGRWVFGHLHQSNSKWLEHQNKPHEYSTALSTKMARTVVNIAVPKPEGVKAIDPCCGIGTVLIEACSMGVNIDGSDLNIRVVYGSRKNLAHFGYSAEVSLKDIREVTGDYDVAIIDMPYNLCSVISDEERYEMFKSACSFANKVVIVTIDPVDEIVKNAGLTIIDRCKASKNKTFTREVLVTSASHFPKNVEFD
ncbi:TRM11 family SAM-dependent methyltransferase [Evansella halocellulosilytica]|uniref:TRM11 family SAM-dependent methyltransferase n=1 Tax=Evansella halocellulosilytica TaxID=2011013 RepID=UPI00211BF0A8|nr:RNA methyltransferase [Evansella halocellulosilytica]